MKEKNSFIVYYEWEDLFNKLSDAQIAEMFKAMFAFAKRNEEPEFSDNLLDACFCIIRYAIKRDKQKYYDRCLKNAENIRKRWETAESEPPQKKPDKAN